MYIYIYTYVLVYVRMHVCIYAYMYVYVHMHMYTYICMYYVSIYTHTHIAERVQPSASAYALRKAHQPQCMPLHWVWALKLTTDSRQAAYKAVGWARSQSFRRWPGFGRIQQVDALLGSVITYSIGSHRSRRIQSWGFCFLGRAADLCFSCPSFIADFAKSLQVQGFGRKLREPAL